MKNNISGKVLEINDKKVEFEYPIEKVVEFDGIYIVMFIGENIIPLHNIVALDTNGKMLWNIADVIQLGLPEAYVGLGKEDNRHAWVRSVSEVETTFDVYTKEIIEQEVVI